jgi:tetratricopeptide (TPR) repeat protein
MRYFFIALLMMIFTQKEVSAQAIHSVSLEERNKAIDLTNEAIMHIEDMNTGRAMEKLQEAIAIDATHRQAYLQVYQAARADAGLTETALKELNKARKIFTDDDELVFYCAEIHRMKSDFKQAVEEYDLAIKLSKNNGEDFFLVPYYYLNRGISHLALKLPEKALEDFNYSIKLKPDFSASITNRGILYYQLGQKEEACKDWNQARKQNYKPAQEFFEKHCAM